jgi:hypothetical protein
MYCKLCDSRNCKFHEFDKFRKYFICSDCGLIFVPEEDWVTLEDEVDRYDKHENNITNEGYVCFLNEVVSVVKTLRKKSPCILDFGSGKNAVLSLLLNNEGFDCEAYDPLYNRLLKNSGKQYDVIVLCEVIEHIRDLSLESILINKLLSPDGIIIIRTKLYPSKNRIFTWWYTQDKTHINFFSRQAVDAFASKFGKRTDETLYPDIFILY